jgi:hypothetical protein
MLSFLKPSIKFHALCTKSSIQERLGHHAASERTMNDARKIVKDYTKKFKSENAAR